MIIFKAFIEFAAIFLLLFVFWFFGYEARGILTSQPGMESTSPAQEGEVLTTELPG